MTATAVMPSADVATPETYLNPDRPGTWVQPLQPGVHFYAGVIDPHLNEFALHGTWSVNSEAAMPVRPGALIEARFQAANVYLVLTSAGGVPRHVGVLLDGRPISAADAGADVHGGLTTVRGQRLYSLIALRGDEQHDLTVQVPPGVSAYDFTFG